MSAHNWTSCISRDLALPRLLERAQGVKPYTDVVTAARDFDDLHHLVDRLTPRQAARLRVLVASDPELAPDARPGSEDGGQRQPSIIGIWQSGRSDLSERHDEIIRERLKRPA